MHKGSNSSETSSHSSDNGLSPNLERSRDLDPENGFSFASTTPDGQDSEDLFENTSDSDEFAFDAGNPQLFQVQEHGGPSATKDKTSVVESDVDTAEYRSAWSRIVGEYSDT